MSVRSTSTRYGNVAIAFHWLSAVAIIFAFIGGLVMANSTEPGTVATILPIHISLGVLALLLTLGRIGWWIWGDKRPAPVGGQPAAQEWAARVVHGLLYAVILLLATSGITTVAVSGAIPALLAGTPLPDFSVLIPRIAHGLLSKLLLVLLVAHVGAALYHQFVRRDHLLARMGVGRA